jgi:hypothetical protein
VTTSEKLTVTVLFNSRRTSSHVGNAALSLTTKINIACTPYVGYIAVSSGEFDRKFADKLPAEST